MQATPPLLCFVFWWRRWSWMVAGVDTTGKAPTPPPPLLFFFAVRGGRDNFGRGELRGTNSSLRKVAKISPGEIWGLWQCSVCM